MQMAFRIVWVFSNMILGRAAERKETSQSDNKSLVKAKY
jgi:hypothetical protein